MNQTEKEKFIATVLAKIASAYQNFMINQYSVEMWLSGLKGLTPKEVWLSLDKHIATSKFSPTIAELREIAMAERKIRKKAEKDRKTLENLTPTSESKEVSIKTQALLKGVVAKIKGIK